MRTEKLGLEMNAESPRSSYTNWRDFTTPFDESVQRLQAIIDEVFSRSKEN